jgi:arylformamidase
MKIFDISLNISTKLPFWPGDQPPVISRTSKIEAGDEANVSRIDMTVHCGTHVDAPYHFLGRDSETVEKLRLSVLVGPVEVIAIPDEINLITRDVLQNIPIKNLCRRVLFRTKNSQFWESAESNFRTDFVAVSPDGAEYLVERNVKLVGVDYLSIAPFQDVGPTHRILLEAGVVIVEGINLSEIQAGEYNLFCLPLKISGADGAPARVILVKDH